MANTSQRSGNLGPFEADNGKVDAIIIARLFAEDVLFFPEEQLERSGNKLSINLQFNRAKAEEYPLFALFYLNNIQMMLEQIMDLFAHLDTAKELQLSKSEIHKDMLRPLLDDRLTGLSFLNLMAYHMVKIVEQDDRDQYLVAVDRDLIAGIPNAYHYICKFIRFARRYNERSGGFHVQFAITLNMDSPIDGISDPVPGAAKKAIGALAVSSDGTITESGETIQKQILEQYIKEHPSSFTSRDMDLPQIQPNFQSDSQNPTSNLTPEMLKRELQSRGNIRVVGTKYEGRPGRIEKLKVGDKLKLVREPNNEYDANAIDLRSSLGSVGHLPAEIAEMLSPLLDSHSISCTAETVFVDLLTKAGKKRVTPILDVKLLVSNSRASGVSKGGGNSNRKNDYSAPKSVNRQTSKEKSDSRSQNAVPKQSPSKAEVSGKAAQSNSDSDGKALEKDIREKFKTMTRLFDTRIKDHMDHVEHGNYSNEWDPRLKRDVRKFQTMLDDYGKEAESLIENSLKKFNQIRGNISDPVSKSIIEAIEDIIDEISGLKLSNDQLNIVQQYTWKIDIYALKSALRRAKTQYGSNVSELKVERTGHTNNSQNISSYSSRQSDSQIETLIQQASVQKTNDEYKAAILEFMQSRKNPDGTPDHSGMTCTAIGKSIPMLSGCDRSKMSSLCNGLVADGKLVRNVIGGGKILFTLDGWTESSKPVSNYTPTTSTRNSGGCYIATAVYGSYDCPPVWTLRRYRDFTLAKTGYGKAFIQAYYTVSPTLVKWFGKTTWFTRLWKQLLDRMVKKLNAEGVLDTPYNDENTPQ